MEPIAAVRDIVFDVLENDSQIMSVPNRFWVILKEIPKVGTGPGSTPEAFYKPSESTLEAGKLKPTISVLDGGDEGSPNGMAHNGFVSFPLVYGYVPANDHGEELLGILLSKLHYHFPRVTGKWYPLGSGPQVAVKTIERQLFRSGEEFGYPNRKFAIWRIEGTFVRPMEG